MASEDAPNEESRYAAEYKIVIVGESAVGKTALLYQFSDGIFKNGLISTIGLDFRTKIIDVEGVPIRLQVWDTAGQERFRTLSKQLFRSAKGIVLVFDITNRKSFEQLSYWLNSFDSYGVRDEGVLLLGNKSDLEDERNVPMEEAKKLANDHSYNYVETSAKLGTNVLEAFTTLAKELHIKYGPYLPNRTRPSVRQNYKSGSKSKIEPAITMSSRVGELRRSLQIKSHRSNSLTDLQNEGVDETAFKLGREGGQKFNKCCTN